VNARAQAIALVQGALAAVEAERAYINDLNVYPVPDGDTGTNLALTVRAILDELEAAHGTGIKDVAAAIAKGSLMGARGNSGVILSQIIRGVCDVCSVTGSLDTGHAKRALVEGAEAAYRAVRQPVEGTMLTVIRTMAEAAQDVPDSAPLAALAEHVDRAGRVAVERTPEQLAVLKQNGVVDAGGYGLVVIFGGLLAIATGQAVQRVAAREGRAAEAAREVMALRPAELSRYRYCTSLVIKGADVSRDDVEAFVSGQGDSALVVGDEEVLKIHVHVDDPGAILSFGAKHGGIGAVEINDMHEQTRERDERLAVETQASAVVAVVAGEGNKKLFTGLGCGAIIDGGQSMNPSAAQLLEAVDAVAAADVVVLPNNGNVILAAEQASTMSRRRSFVVPSRSIPAGLSAMVAFDPGVDGAANAMAMSKAIERVHSAEITHAVRDSEIDGVHVARGQAIGLVDGRLVAADDELLQVFRNVVGKLAEDEPELLTILTALNGSQITADELARVAQEVCPACELSLHEGGQPLYPILAAAE